MAKRRPPQMHYTKLPAGVQYAGALRIQRQQARGTIVDVMQVPEKLWLAGRYRFLWMEELAQQTGPIGERIDWLSRLLRVTPRTVQRWLRIYRKNPDVMALVPRARGPTIGHRSDLSGDSRTS